MQPGAACRARPRSSPSRGRRCARRSRTASGPGSRVLGERARVAVEMDRCLGRIRHLLDVRRLAVDRASDATDLLGERPRVSATQVPCATGDSGRGGDERRHDVVDKHGVRERIGGPAQPERRPAPDGVDDARHQAGRPLARAERVVQPDDRGALSVPGGDARADETFHVQLGQGIGHRRVDPDCRVHETIQPGVHRGGRQQDDPCRIDLAEDRRAEHAGRLEVPPRFAHGQAVIGVPGEVDHGVIARAGHLGRQRVRRSPSDPLAMCIAGAGPRDSATTSHPDGAPRTT